MQIFSSLISHFIVTPCVVTFAVIVVQHRPLHAANQYSVPTLLKHQTDTHIATAWYWCSFVGLHAIETIFRVSDYKATCAVADSGVTEDSEWRNSEKNFLTMLPNYLIKADSCGYCIWKNCSRKVELDIANNVHQWSRVVLFHMTRIGPGSTWIDNHLKQLSDSIQVQELQNIV